MIDTIVSLGLVFVATLLFTAFIFLLLGLSRPRHNSAPFPHRYYSGLGNDGEISTYPINDILKSGKFTAEERKREYRRRGKSPSGVIDGIYNDAYRGNDGYNDTLRDWDADA